jgi:hypothetical protein
LRRGINEFKKGYQPTDNFVEAGNDRLLADLPSILNNTQEVPICQPLSAQGVNDVGQTAVHSAQALAYEPNSFEVHFPVEHLKRYKLTFTGQIWQNRSKQKAVRCLLTSTNLLNALGTCENFQSSGRNLLS